MSYGPRTNTNPSGVPAANPYTKRKLASEYGKQQQRKDCFGRRDYGFIIPPPPYQTEVTMTYNHSRSEGDCAASRSPIQMCSNCHHLIHFSPSASPAEYESIAEEHSLPPFSATSPFQEVREVILKKNPNEIFGLKLDALGEHIYVTTVAPDSPAANVGLKAGDEIVQLNTVPINTLGVSQVMDSLRICETELQLMYRPRSVVAQTQEIVLEKVTVLGLRLQRRLNGLFIDKVVPDSPAEMAGIKEGSELLRINDQYVIEMTSQEATELLKTFPSGSVIRLLVRDIFPTAHVEGCRLAKDQEGGSLSVNADPLKRDSTGNVNGGSPSQHPTIDSYSL